MADARVTTLKVKVNLTCDKCKKKIKKVLCQIPEIENQVYDEKNNAVTITVVCGSPEKIKKKIFRKGGDIILGIEILKPPDKKPPESDKKPPEADKKQPEADKKQPEPPSKPEQPPRCDCCREGSVIYVWGPCYPGYGWPSPPCYCSCHSCYGRPVCDCRGSGCGRC